MGQLVNAFIEHKLSPEDILRLPEQLQHISDERLVGIWRWTRPNLDKDKLLDLWKRDAEYFLNHSWNTEDIPQLEKNDMSLLFITPNLLLFGSFLRWDIYCTNSRVKSDFNQLTKSIMPLTKAIDILFVPNLSGNEFYDEERDLTVDSYRKKANGNEMYAIELC